MSKEKFIDGFFVKEPHANAPDFVKFKISMKREEVIAWLQGRDDDWINLDVKESRDGKLYAQIDAWKPDKSDSQEPPFPDSMGDDVPF